MTKYLTEEQHRWHTNLLDSAIRSGKPDKVIATVHATFAAWDADDFAYPDDWHRWERARRDAERDLVVDTWKADRSDTDAWWTQPVSAPNYDDNDPENGPMDATAKAKRRTRVVE